MKKKKTKTHIPVKPNKLQNLSSLFYNFLKKEQIKDFIAVFIITFIISLIITSSKRPIDTHPNFGDAYYYFHNAELFSKVWKSPFHYIPGLLFDTLSKQETQEIGFNHQSDFNSFFRAPGYITFLSLWITVFGTSEFALLLSQVFLLSAVFGFIYLILRKFVNRKYSFMSIFAAILYLTFYNNALQTLTEIFQTLVILMFFYYLYKTIIKDKNSKKEYVILALFLLIVNFSKMSNKYIHIFLIPVIIYLIYTKYKNYKKLFKKFSMTFLISFFIMLFFVNLITSRGSGGVESANLGGWRNYWAGTSRLSDGFGINTGDHEKEFRDNINKGTRKFWFNRYSEICKYALIDTIKNYPFEYLLISLKKMGLLLSHAPQNNETIKLFQHIRAVFMNKFHFLLLLLTIICMFFLVNKQIKNIFILKIFFFTLTLYLSMLFGLSNPDARYFLPLIPFLIISSTIIVYFIYEKRLYKQQRYVIPILIILITVILLYHDSILNFIFQNIILIRLIKILLYLFIIGLVVKLLMPFFNKYNIEDKILTGIIIFFVFMLSFPFIFFSKYDNHFAVKSSKITQIIQINNLNNFTYEKVLLAIDISTENPTADIRLRINSFTTNITISKAQESFSKNYPLPFNKTLYKPHWLFVNIPLSIIEQTNKIEVTYRNANIYYSYKEKNRRIPSFFNYKHGLNDIVYGPFSKTDNRCYPITKLYSKRRITLINNKRKNYDAHIFFLIKEKGDYYLPKKYEKFNDANIKYIALVNPLDRKLVFYSRNNPGPDFVKVRGNLYLYLAGELDRFYSGYYLY